MRPSKPGEKPAGSPTPSTTPLSEDIKAFHKWAAEAAQAAVDNLNRNALADKAKYEAMVKKTS